MQPHYQEIRNKVRASSCDERTYTSLVLYSHSCVNRIAGLSNKPKSIPGIFAYANDFRSLLKPLAYEGLLLKRQSGGKNWLESLLGFEPRVVELNLPID